MTFIEYVNSKQSGDVSRALPQMCRWAEEYADQQSVLLAKRVIEGLSYYGCTMSEDNAGYSYFIAGSGIRKGMGAELLIEHLTQPNILDDHAKENS